MAQVLSTSELDIESRKRLYGKVSTIRDWISEVLRLRNGDTRRHQIPLNNSDICKLLGISRPWLNGLFAIAEQHGLDKQTDASKSQSEFARFESDEFMQDPLVREWVDDMRTRKGGKGKKTWKQSFNALKRFCNTLKIKPEQLIIDKQTYKKLLQNLKLELDNGNHDRPVLGSKGLPSVESVESTTFHTMKMASRNFVQFHGIPLPRGEDGIVSGKVVNHGKYKDIRLSFDELDKAENYLIEKYGLDSDIFRLFFVGVECGPRQVALMRMRCEWSESKSPKTGITTFYLKAHETKTEDTWQKFIRRPKTQESLRLQSQRNSNCIINFNDKSLTAKSKELMVQLRDLYKFLGKHESNDGYFMRKPFHALRHIATQYWLALTDGNLAFVKKAVGWRSTLELEASYGEMPPEVMERILDKIE